MNEETVKGLIFMALCALLFIAGVIGFNVAADRCKTHTLSFQQVLNP